jgi:hypothetical protein
MPDYVEWLNVGKPDCWCYPRQCHGDSDDAIEGNSKTGYYYVGYNDLNMLLAGFKVLEPDFGPGIATVSDFDNFGYANGRGICGDNQHDVEGNSKTGYYRVGYNDLNQLVGYAFKRYEIPHNDPCDPLYPNGIPADCIPN